MMSSAKTEMLFGYSYETDADGVLRRFTPLMDGVVFIPGDVCSVIGDGSMDDCRWQFSVVLDDRISRFGSGAFQRAALSGYAMDFSRLTNPREAYGAIVKVRGGFWRQPFVNIIDRPDRIGLELGVLACRGMLSETAIGVVLNSKVEQEFLLRYKAWLLKIAGHVKPAGWSFVVHSTSDFIMAFDNEAVAAMLVSYRKLFGHDKSMLRLYDKLVRKLNRNGYILDAWT